MECKEVDYCHLLTMCEFYQVACKYLLYLFLYKLINILHMVPFPKYDNTASN